LPGQIIEKTKTGVAAGCARSKQPNHLAVVIEVDFLR
jgi:hypothetical protein